MSKVPSNEAIAARAYEIFLERGGEHGHDAEDWAAAEKELNARHKEIQALYEQEKPQREDAQLGYAAAASGRRR
jgi:hypothetical protein